MQSKHFVGRITQKAIIERDGKILICRGKGDSLWELPGGRLHVKESPKKGLVREIKEELAMTVTVGLPIHVTSSFHTRDNQDQLFIAYSCSIPMDAAPQPDYAELEEVRWISFDELSTVELFEDCREALHVYTRQ